MVIHDNRILVQMIHLDIVNYRHNQLFIKAFGENLKRLREEKGLSLRQFAEIIEIEHKQLFRIEKGMINTTISTAQALAEGLDIPVSKLFDFPWKEDSPKNED